jgi:hypothetical protein
MILAIVMLALATVGQAVAHVGAADPKLTRDELMSQLHACDPAKVQSLVGRPADTQTVARALKLSNSSSIRVVRPGDPISMDYSSDRITIEIGDDNRIVRLTCG